jgi:alpha-glucosidase
LRGVVSDLAERASALKGLRVRIERTPGAYAPAIDQADPSALAEAVSKIRREPSAVTAIANNRAGAVEGTAATSWRPNLNGPPILGIDVGGTKTAIVVARRDGTILHRDEFPSNAARGFDAMYADIGSHVKRALAKHPEVGSIGVSVGGPLESSTGVVHSPPHLPGWDDVELGRMLKEQFGRPAYVEHDAKAGALAEWIYGAGKDVDNLVFLTLGTGLGGGIISGGRLVQGAQNAAGELGHWRVNTRGPKMYGKTGSLEGWASGAGIAELAQKLHPQRFAAGTTAKEIARLAKANDPDALDVLAKSGRHLGKGLALIVDLLAPEKIVLGNLAPRLGDAFVNAAMETLKKEALPESLARCEIVPSQLGESIGDVAALCAALYHEPQQSEQDHPWWESSVFYQIYPRSYQDTNGDGIGDLPGITARLDHLQELGVDALWITPFFPSPQVDFGYDVQNYVDVDPQFGSLADFDRLIKEAHQRGIKVIIDLVPNHTSDKHPWFVEARKSRDNPFRDFYVWRDPDPETGGPPNNWDSCFQSTGWTLDENTNQYYYHAFYPEQPDLNWRNPKVEEAMFDVVRFWLDRGVDGFRIDAVNHLFEDEQLRDNPVLDEINPRTGEPYQIKEHTKDLPEVHGVLKRMRKVVEEYGDDKLLITEAYVPKLEDLAAYYGNGDDEVQLPFNFFLAEIDKLDATKFRGRIDEIERVLGPRATTYVLSNHDIERAVDRFGPRAKNEEMQKLLTTLLLTLRGSPFIYYGEELGMVNRNPRSIEEVQDPVGRRYWPHNKGRDGERTPMQWNSGKNAGFTDAIPWLKIPRSAKQKNVEQQSIDPTSVLSYTKRALAIRRELPSLQTGSYRPIGSDPHVLAYERGGEVLVALNMSNKPRVFSFGDEHRSARVLFGSKRPTGKEIDPRDVVLAPYEAVVLKPHHRVDAEALRNFTPAAIDKAK